MPESIFSESRTDNRIKMRRLLENERFPDGRSACRIAAELRVDCGGGYIYLLAEEIGARPFLMADGRQGFTLRDAPAQRANVRRVVIDEREAEDRLETFQASDEFSTGLGEIDGSGA